MKRLLILTVASLTAFSCLGAQAKEQEELEMVQSVPRSTGVYCLAISNDDRFLYSTGPSTFMQRFAAI